LATTALPTAMARTATVAAASLLNRSNT
jgi:hypothetical protein